MLMVGTGSVAGSTPVAMSWTRADSVAKLTATPDTPGTFLSARSTRATHDAQVMPPIPISRVDSLFMALSVKLPTVARSSAFGSTGPRFKKVLDLTTMERFKLGFILNPVPMEKS